MIRNNIKKINSVLIIFAGKTGIEYTFAASSLGIVRKIINMYNESIKIYYI